LLCLYFKIVSRQTEMTHCSEWATVRHAVIERTVGKWCQRYRLCSCCRWIF